jgi:hypothetical protein
MKRSGALRIVVLGLVLIPGCGRGPTFEDLVVAETQSTNRAAAAVEGVHDADSARRAMATLDAETQRLVEIREQLVGLGKVTDADRERAQRLVPESLDATRRWVKSMGTLDRVGIDKFPGGVGKSLGDAVIRYAMANADLGVGLFRGTSKPGKAKGPAPEARASTGIGQAPSLRGLETVWSIPGAWDGVASDAVKGTVIATAGGDGVELDPAGRERRRFHLPKERAGNSLLIAGRRGARGSVLLKFNRWVPDVELRAFDQDGVMLWTYPDGYKDVATYDLDGDGSNEVIVGYPPDTPRVVGVGQFARKGIGGLHVLGADGKLLWKSGADLNVAGIGAGDIVRGGRLQVVASLGGTGRIQFFSASGAAGRLLDPGVYATDVCVIPGPKPGTARAVVVGANTYGEESAKRGATLVALAGEVGRKWELTLPASDRSDIHFLGAATDRPWLAAGTAGGRIYVVDAEAGRVIAELTSDLLFPPTAISWAAVPTPGLPLLLVTSVNGLHAYRVAPAASREQPGP